MSLEFCDKCDTVIDTDFNAEHFDEDVQGCETTYLERQVENVFEKSLRQIEETKKKLKKITG